MADTNNSNLFDQAIAYLRADRSRRRWRMVAVLLFLILVGTIISIGGHDNKTPPSFVAQIELNGVITDSLYQQDILESIRTNDHAKAVLVYIDSPGGTMVGGVSLYKILRRIAADKPVVTVMGTVAASAGYMVAAAGDHIVANEGSLTGSIGVLMPLVDATQLADKIGLKSDEIVSGNLKAVTSPLYNRTKDDRAYLQDTVMDMQQVFLNLVKEQRQLSAETITLISDGRVLAGTTAHKLGLVDQLGDRQTARQWLETEHNIPVKTPLVSFELEEKRGVLKELLEGADSILFSQTQQQGIMALLR